MELKFTKHELKGTSFSEPVIFSNGADLLDLFESGNSFSSFSLIFNGELQTFKSWAGVSSKAEGLIKKFNLSKHPKH